MPPSRGRQSDNSPELLITNVASPSIGTYRRREQCRVCGDAKLSSFLDYGNMPLAGGFVRQDELPNTKVYPMDLALCLNCSLVQIPNVVAAEVLFTNYRYLSSVTTTLAQHFRDYAGLLKREILPREKPFLVEIGCNDGVLLTPLRDLGIDVLGVDAAENVVAIARERGHEVIHGFFGIDIAETIRSTRGRPDVITASNVFAHIDDLDEVMKGVDTLLSPDGTFIVEVHYIADLLSTFQFDTVYHEHLCYYSVHALQVLYARFGFTITNVQHLPMHGGAIRVFAARANSPTRRIDPEVSRVLEHERALGLHRLETYTKFAERVEQYRDGLSQFLWNRKGEGRTLSAFGAAGRATILLNYCNLDRSILEYVVDESPFRRGRFVPGVAIPIVGPAELTVNPTDDCLITAWNYRDEILRKHQDYLNGGGSFVMPLPVIEIISK